MNPILERLTRINMSHLSTDSALRFIQEGNYIFFQTIQSGPDRLPLKLFAVDTDQQKLVLDILATEAKSPHQKTDVAQIEAFYIRHKVQGDSFSDYLSAVTQDKRELEVGSRYSLSTRDLEEMSLVLGVICNKPVQRRLQNGEVVFLNTWALLA